MCPTPEPDLYKKFEFFYGPYNFIANTQKYLTYDDVELACPITQKNSIAPKVIDYEMNQP